MEFRWTNLIKFNGPLPAAAAAEGKKKHEKERTKNEEQWPLISSS